MKDATLSEAVYKGAEFFKENVVMNQDVMNISCYKLILLVLKS